MPDYWWWRPALFIVALTVTLWAAHELFENMRPRR